jgi:hypothetical protein
MAINDENKQAGAQQQEQQPNVQPQATRPIGGFLGGMDRLTVLAATRNSQYTTDFVAAINKFYDEKLGKDAKPLIQVLDKSVIPGLAYSTVVISTGLSFSYLTVT